MDRMRLLLVVALGALALAGCPNGDDDAPSCVDYAPPADFDPNAPAVSLSRDVLPIFTRSCAFSSCHGSTTGNPNGVFLGGTDATKIRIGLVDIPADELPSMPFVKAGAPRESYLMRKLDGSQCALDDQCKDTSCGESMPRGEPRLPLEQRDVVRRWIAQGAQDN